MTPPEQNNQTSLDLTSDAALKAAREKGAADKAKEAPDTREKALQVLRDSAKREISASAAELQATGKNIDEPTQRYLEQYFQSSINRFDKDKDGKINASEAKDFQTAMMQKTKDIIGQVKQGAEAEKKMEAAAAKAEAMKPEEVGKNLDSIKEIGDLSDLEQANNQLQELQGQNSAFQQGVQNQLNEVQKFGAAYNNFQQAQQGFGHFKELYNAVVNSTERNLAIAKMKGTLEAQKTAVATLLTSLTAKKKILDENGEKIKAAIAKARQEAIRERDAKVAEIKQQNEENQEKVAERKKEYARLEKSREEMEKRQKGILEKQKHVDKLKQDWETGQGKENFDQKEKTYRDSDLDLDAEIKGYQTILDSPDVAPDYKQKIQEELQKAQERQKKTRMGLQVIDARKKGGQVYEKELEEQAREAGKELSSADGHLKRQDETLKGLTGNINTLENLQLQYATSSAEAEKFYNKRIDLLDQHQQSVDEFALNSAMGRQQSLNALQQAANSLSGMSVESKGYVELLNPLEMIGSGFKGVGGALHGAAQWIDGNVRDVLNMTRNGDGFWDKTIYYGTQFGSVFTGFVSGALELGGGVFSLSGGLVSDIGSIPTSILTLNSKNFHAFDTLKGLGAIVGYDAAKGEFTLDKFGETLATIGKTVVGYGTNWGYSKDANGQEVWRDEYGTGLGKGVFNVLSLFVGAGEAKGAVSGATAAEKAGSMLGKAGIAGDAARLAAIDAAAAAGRGALMTGLAGRGAQVLAFSKAFVSELVKKMPFIKNAVTEARIARPLGKPFAVIKSLGNSALEGLGNAGSAIKSFVTRPDKLSLVGKGISAVGKGAVKVTAEIIAMPIKLTWNVLKSFGKTGEAFRNVARGLANPRAVAAAETTARIGKAADVIQSRTTEYAEVRTRLQEIIDNDPVLTERAVNLEKNVEGLSAENLSRQKMALESDAVRKLAQSNPELSVIYQDVRRASDVIRSETSSYIKATRKEAEAAMNSVEAKAVWDQHSALQTELKQAQSAQNPALVKEVEKKIQTFKENPQTLNQFRRYEDAKIALDNLEKFDGEMQKIQESLLGSGSGKASRLAGEISEARAVALNSDLAITNSPAFSRHFLEEYQGALAKGDKAAVTSAESSLGTVHPEGPLRKALNEMRDNPALATDQAFMESFQKALRENQKISLNLFEQFENSLPTMTSETFSEMVKSFPEEWRPALQEMRERATFLNRLNNLKAELSVNRLRSEYNRIITPEMTGQQAADVLYKRYANDTLAPASSAGTSREVASGIRLKDSATTYNMRVIDDGSVRLFNQSGEMLLTTAESRAISSGLRIRPSLTGQELAEQLAGHNVPGKPLAPGETRLLSGELNLADGKYTLRLNNQGKLELINEKGNLMVSTKPVPVQAPAESTAAAGEITLQSGLNRGVPANTDAIAGEISLESGLDIGVPANTNAPRPPAERMRNAIESNEKARVEFHIRRKEMLELDKRIAPMEDQLRAMEIRNAPAPQIKAMQSKIDALRTLRNEAMENAEFAANSIMGNRMDYWSARVQEKGLAVKNYIGLDRRVAWLKDKSKILGKVAETGVGAVRTSAKYLREAMAKQTEYYQLANPKVFMYSRAGLEVNQHMNALRAAAGHQPAVTGLLQELALDQYRILRQVDGGRESLGLPPESEFAAMSNQDQLKVLGGAYAQLDSSAATDSGNVYTEAQKNYIQERQTTISKTLTDLQGQSAELTPENITAALDTALGPQGSNDSQKGYEVKFEEVTVSVDQDGKRTYSGLEQWAAKALLRRQVQNIMAENMASFMPNEAQWKKDYPDHPLSTADDLRTLFTDHLTRQITAGIKDKNPGSGITIESKEKNGNDEPIFTAVISPDGAVRVSPSQKYVENRFAQYQKENQAVASRAPDKKHGVSPSTRTASRSTSKTVSPSENPPSSETPDSPRRDDDIFT